MVRAKRVFSAHPKNKSTPKYTLSTAAYSTEFRKSQSRGRPEATWSHNKITVKTKSIGDEGGDKLNIEVPTADKYDKPETPMELNMGSTHSVGAKYTPHGSRNLMPSFMQSYSVNDTYVPIHSRGSEAPKPRSAKRKARGSRSRQNKSLMGIAASSQKLNSSLGSKNRMQALQQRLKGPSGASQNVSSFQGGKRVDHSRKRK